MRSVRRVGRLGRFGVAVSCLLVGGLAFPLESFAAEEAAPRAAGESSKIKARAERQIGKQERPTIKKRAETRKKDARARRVSLQIPERLRAALAEKIERRISRNIEEGKRLRREAHELLEKLIRESPEDAPEMPEALLRIGELEWEEARDKFITAFEKWEKTPADLRDDAPLPDYSVPRGRFSKVLKRHKTFKDYDLALYVDGFLATEEGKFDEALVRFDKIIEWFPESRFVPDAHMARAEHEFTKDAPNYETAYNEYEAVLAYKKSELYDLALFKSAWTLWRLGKPEEAAKRFLIVFKAAQDSDRAKTKKKKEELDELQNEALKNLVAVFVEDEKNRAEDMHRFLVKAGGEKFAGQIVRTLAEAFYDQSHYERGIEAYRLLLRLEPTSPDAYEYALKIAQAHSTLEAWKELEKDYRWILREYTAPPAGEKKQKASAWAQVQTPEKIAEAEKAIEAQLRQDAVGLHAKAQADKNSKAEFEGAQALYSVYLSRFSKTKQAYEVYFNLGEIHFYRLENATEAADAYLAAVRLNPNGELSRTALYNALAALEVARATEFEASRKAGKKQEESELDKKLTEAMELYVRSYPNDKEIPELLFRQGKLYYDYQVFDVAVRQWGLLLEKYPTDQHAAAAGELVLDSFNKSKDYGNIETWARRLKSAPAFQTPAQQTRLNGLIVAAVFKQGEQLSQGGKHDKAAQAYLRAAREFPREERAAQAAVNAAIEAKRAGDLATLGVAANLLMTEHKTRPEAAQGLWIAAQTHQEVGLFAEAAAYDAQIVDYFPRSDHHKDAALNAVLLRTTIGDHKGAIESGEKFKKYYPKDDSADEVTFLMGKAHEKAGKKREAATLYDRYAKSAKTASSQIEALVRLAAVSADERTRSSALERAVHTYGQRKQTLDQRGKYYAAKARYMQGEAYLQRFDAVKIEGNVKQLKDRLKQKSELLKKAAEAFLATAEMGVAEWTTAALYQIGATYESFSKALLNSPPPPSLGEEEKEIYRQSIEEFVIPIEERSLEAYESGWQKALELGIFNAWTAKMREALGRLNAELYPPLKETGFEIRSQAASPMPALIAAPRRKAGGESEPYLIATEAEEEKPGDGKPGAKPGEDKAGAKPAADGAGK
jgi:TolA-binding protein